MSEEYFAVTLRKLKNITEWSNHIISEDTLLLEYIDFDQCDLNNLYMCLEKLYHYEHFRTQ